MSTVDIVARGLASQALASQASPQLASDVMMADGASVQQAIEVAANSDDLVALMTPFPVGSQLGTADGHCYLVVAAGSGDLITAGSVELRILPDAAGEYHFEAAAPNSDMLTARAWAMYLPDGAVLNIAGSYVIDSSAEFANRICAKGPGKWTLRPGPASAVVQLTADGCEWYVDLDGNKGNVTTGTPSALVVLGAADVKVGATITNAKGSGIYATQARNLRLLASLRVSGADQSGVVIADGSDYLVIEDGAEITNNGYDNIYVSDANGAPCRHVSIGRVNASAAGQAGGGYWSGLRLRYVEQFLVAGLVANDCVSGAGWIVQSSATSPETRFSSHGTIEGTRCTGNNDGGVIDDYSQFVTSTANQLNGNLQDGLDINDTFGCVSRDDTCNDNGNKGILLGGSRSARVCNATACNNAVATDGSGNPLSTTDSGINIQTSGSTGTVPINCTVTGGQCSDTRSAKTQNYGVRISAGTGHRVRDVDVSANKVAGINDASGTSVQNPKCGNIGYKTESSFWAVIPAGSTSIFVSGGSTGIVATGATLQNVSAVPTGSYPAGYQGHSISEIGSQGFRINLPAALAEDVTFNCTAEVYGAGAGL